MKEYNIKKPQFSSLSGMVKNNIYLIFGFETGKNRHLSSQGRHKIKIYQ